MHLSYQFLFRAAVLAGLSLVASASSAAPVPASEQISRTEALPKRLRGIDVTERLGQFLPQNLCFTDEEGRPALLQDAFDGRVPVILTLNYSNCPMLCSLQLHALVEGLKKVDWTLGRDYRMLTVSLDPTETTELAHRTRARYLAQYGRPGAENGWHFLHGSAANVQAYARALGIHYAYNEARGEYVHPAAIVLAAPSGKLVRYLYGLDYLPTTMRLSLVESSEGKIGTTVDRLILFCFHYDAEEGRYAPVARNIMRIGGAASVLFLAGFVLMLLRIERKRDRQHSPPGGDPPIRPEQQSAIP
jgi:protein SCO1